MRTVFYAIINMSFFGLLLGLLPFLLRRIKQIPKNFIILLWYGVFLRFLIPVAPGSRLSLMNLLKPLIRRNFIASSVPGTEVKLSFTNAVGLAKQYAPLTYENDKLQRQFDHLSLIWAVGLILLLIVGIVIYLMSTYDLLKNSRASVQKSVYINNGLNSPLVHGFWNQKIFMPEKVLEDEETLGYVLLHENVHLKRHDNKAKLLVMILCGIHWYNPAIWLYAACFYQDLEESCDLKVLQQLSSEERKKYANILLKLAIKKDEVFASAFGGSKLRSRLELIMAYQNIPIWVYIPSLLFMLILLISLLTNAA